MQTCLNTKAYLSLCQGNPKRVSFRVAYMKTLAERLTSALAERQASAAPGERITKAGLARACGIKQPSVSDWFSGDTATIEGRNLVAAASYLCVSPEWLATGRGQRRLREDSRPDNTPYLNAQISSIGTTSRTLPVRITWEHLMQSKELPERFELEAPDDALAPNIPRGTVVTFERAGSASAGRCVLVQDRRGAWYMRRYVQGAGGTFKAQPTHDAYVALDSESDGVQVRAVMVARTQFNV